MWCSWPTLSKREGGLHDWVCVYSAEVSSSDRSRGINIAWALMRHWVGQMRVGVRRFPRQQPSPDYYWPCLKKLISLLGSIVNWRHWGHTHRLCAKVILLVPTDGMWFDLNLTDIPSANYVMYSYKWRKGCIKHGCIALVTAWLCHWLIDAFISCLLFYYHLLHIGTESKRWCHHPPITLSGEC